MKFVYCIDLHHTSSYYISTCHGLFVWCLSSSPLGWPHRSYADQPTSHPWVLLASERKLQCPSSLPWIRITWDITTIHLTMHWLMVAARFRYLEWFEYSVVPPPNCNSQASYGWDICNKKFPAASTARSVAIKTCPGSKKCRILRWIIIRQMKPSHHHPSRLQSPST